jgi:hypothetical protein
LARGDFCSKTAYSPGGTVLKSFSRDHYVAEVTPVFDSMQTVLWQREGTYEYTNTYEGQDYRAQGFSKCGDCGGGGNELSCWSVALAAPIQFLAFLF